MNKFLIQITYVGMAAAFLLLPFAASAKSTVVTQSLTGDLYAQKYLTTLCLLHSPQFQENYAVTVTDGSGNPIADGGTVTQGSTVKLNFTPAGPNDIYWFGSADCADQSPSCSGSGCIPPGFNGTVTTGFGDSPYGEWGTSTVKPAQTCNVNDFVSNITTSSNTYVQALYSHLKVDPPTESISAPAGLLCSALSAGTETCTVTGTGSIPITFNFGATTGLFYGRYTAKSDGSCNVFGYVDANGNYVVDPAMAFQDANGNDTNPYTLPVQATSISYTLNVATTNHAPNTPSLTCDSNLTTGQTGNFTASATDPDNDTLRYGFDWTNSGSVSEWAPASGYVNSGTAQTVTHSWSTPGTYTVQALAQDSKSANSGWASCTVTVTQPQPDLSAVAVLSPSTATVGIAQTFTGSNAISNSPAATATSFPNALQIADASHNPITYVAASPASMTLAPSSFGSVTASYTFSTAGSYTVRWCANTLTDGTQKITESDYGNNCSNWIPVTVSTNNQTAASCILTANPSSISSGQTSTLTWSSQNATSCTSSNIPAFPGGTSGSVPGLGASQPGNPYQVTCTGAGGSGSCTASVTSGSGSICTPDSTVDLKAASLQSTPITFTDGPIRVHAAQGGVNNVELQFSQVNVSSGGSCHITRSDTNTTTNFPGSACLVSGSAQNVSVIHSAKFTLSCDGVSGTDSIQVNVIPAIQEF